MGSGFWDSTCFPPVLLILLVALLFLAILGFLVFWYRRKSTPPLPFPSPSSRGPKGDCGCLDKELEQRVEELSRWANRNTTARSMQAVEVGCILRSLRITDECVTLRARALPSVAASHQATTSTPNPWASSPRGGGAWVNLAFFPPVSLEEEVRSRGVPGPG